MNLGEVIRLIVLLIGWPVLIAGSFYLVRESRRFYHQVGRAPFGRVILFMVAGWLITMYCLGVTATAFMWFDVRHGVPIVVPVFVVWAGLMVLITWSVRRWSTEAARIVERLEASNREKTQLINQASHELNTPLTPLKLQMEILRTQLGHGNWSGARASVEVLDRNLERLGRLAHDLVDTSQIQAGRLQLRAQPLDLETLVQGTSDFFAATARTTGVHIECQASIGLQIHADPDRIRQVLSHLVANAVRASPTGGHVRVGARRKDAGVEVWVEDAGTTPTQGPTEDLFQPFRQRDDDRTGLERDTGLGLYLCKGIVEAHGGRIGYRHEGTRNVFAFSLPARS